MSKIVLAVGGNAIIKESQKGTWQEQVNNVNEICSPILDLITSNHTVVITHGNGPQVGNSLIKGKLSEHVVPNFPMDVAVSETQGNLGYLIQKSLLQKMKERQVTKPIASIITQTLVDEADPAFNSPTKPIGPFYTKEEVEQMSEKEQQSFIEDSGRGYRKVVASPKPISILEKESIKCLIDNNHLVIAAGGGGIPVIEKDGQLMGVEAVIDKDFASALLAAEIQADFLFILTGVEQVAIHFGKPEQKNLFTMTVQEANTYLEAGHFPKGSMGPKIEAAITFLEKGGKNVIITSIDKLNDAMEGKTGTRITL